RKRWICASTATPFFCHSRLLIVASPGNLPPPSYPVGAPLGAIPTTAIAPKGAPTSPFDRNPGQFVEPEREVEILHRLRRRALEQVVERGHDHQPLAAGRHGEAADLDAVPAGDPADPGRVVVHAHQR